jgi:hypothetical protein
MKRSPFALVLPAAFAALLAASPARADVAPMCDDFAKNADCAAADVGKDCPDGGTCKEISCESAAGGGSKVTKCVVCNLVEIEDPGKVCEPGPSSFGKSCGDGGTCTKIPSWCASSGYVVCAKESQGAGGSGGSGQAGSGGEAGSGTAGSGDAGSGQAGSGTAGSGTAGSNAAGSSAAGTSGSGAPASDEEDSGCSVSGAGRHGALAGLMLALGAAALLFDRRRR